MRKVAVVQDELGDGETVWPSTAVMQTLRGMILSGLHYEFVLSCGRLGP